MQPSASYIHVLVHDGIGNLPREPCKFAANTKPTIKEMEGKFSMSGLLQSYLSSKLFSSCNPPNMTGYIRLC